MPITLDGTNGITTPMYNGSITANAVTPSVNMKNRIINGNMTIDQRNAGASVSTIAGDTFIVDRFNTYTTQASKLTGQQNAGSVTPPAGFNNYLGLTSTSAYSVGSGDIFTLFQNIEGYNVADLNWGTANAKTVTLSFWVRSSLTGTFGGSLLNGAQNRAYPFSYTISSANTWEQKSITVAGDTTGTWLTTNGRGLIVGLGLGNGSTFSGTAGAWTAGQIYSPTGSTSVVGTNGATFYITGVQLEVGSTATSFDYRPYGTELALCQRYYYKIFPAESSKAYGNGTSVDTTTMYNTVPSPVTMRVNPTLQTTGTASDYAIVRGGGTNTTCNSVPVISDQSTQFVLQVIGTLASGLSTGSSGWLRTASASSFLAFSAEL